MSPSTRIFLNKLRWFLYEKLSAFWDGLLYGLGIHGSKIVPVEGKKTLVFIGEQLPPRIPRMAKWIKREGTYTPWLICSVRGFIPEFSDPCFEQVLLFRNEWHLKRILKRFAHIDILHGYAPKSYFCNVARKAVKTKYVHDMQDVYSIYYDKTPDLGWMKKELPAEKECLEKADGVVGHSLEVNVAYRKFNTQNKPLSIFFPLYCDDDQFIDSKKISDQEIHLVYAGGVAGKHRDPKQYGNIQFHTIIEILTRQDLHFHIYPSPSNLPADYDDYFKIASANKRFHMHQSVPQDRLSLELSKYHYGFHTGFVNQDTHAQSSIKYKYCTTLKLFNFIEAGVPVIISDNLIYQSWTIERHGAGIVIRKDELNMLSTLLKEANYSIQKQNTSLARRKLSLKSNISRLLSFYDSLIRRKETSHRSS